MYLVNLVMHPFIVSHHALLLAQCNVYNAMRSCLLFYSFQLQVWQEGIVHQQTSGAGASAVSRSS